MIFGYRILILICLLLSIMAVVIARKVYGFNSSFLIISAHVAIWTYYSIVSFISLRWILGHTKPVVDIIVFVFLSIVFWALSTLVTGGPLTQMNVADIQQNIPLLDWLVTKLADVLGVAATVIYDFISQTLGLDDLITLYLTGLFISAYIPLAAGTNYLLADWLCARLVPGNVSDPDAECHNHFLNATTTNILAAAALASFALTLLIAYVSTPDAALVPSFAPFQAWVKSFPWQLMAAMLLFLAFVGQKKWRETTLEEILGQAEEESVRPIYERLKTLEPELAKWDIMEDHLSEEKKPHHFSSHNDVDNLDEKALFDKYLDQLISGETLLFEGLATSRFYDFLCEALQCVQDTGQLSVIVCPAGTPHFVKDTLRIINRSIFPEDVFKYDVYDGDYPELCAHIQSQEYPDVLILDERAFRSLFIAGCPEIAWRLGLVVILDLHAMNICGVYSLIHRMQLMHELPEEIGLLVQSLPRKALETTCKNLIVRPRTYLSSRLLHWQISAGHPPEGRGLMVWRSSHALRSSLLALSLGADEQDDVLHKLETCCRTSTTPAFLCLPFANEESSNERLEHVCLGPEIVRWDLQHFVHCMGEHNLGEELCNTLRNAASWQRIASGVGQPAARGDQELKPVNGRITIIYDRENLCDHLYTRYPSHFWSSSRDYLVHIVMNGYPACRYILHRSAQAQRELIMPYAPHLGIGLWEIAEMIAARMRRNPGQSHQAGIRAVDVERLLDLVADKRVIRPLEITASRKGLFRLFNLLDPKAVDSLEKIVSEMDDAQHERYSFQEGIRARVIDRPMFRLRHEARGTDIGFIATSDYGLTYVEECDIEADGAYYNIEHVDEENGTVQLRSIGRGEIDRDPEAQYIFERTYWLRPVPAMDDKQPLFLRLWNRKYTDASNRLQMIVARMLCNVHRRTTRTAWLSTDDEPNLVNIIQQTQQIQRCDPPVEMDLYLRHALVISAPCQNLAHQEQPPAVLHALAASLATVLSYSFPFFRKHVAVFCLGLPDDNTAPNIDEEMHAAVPSSTDNENTAKEKDNESSDTGKSDEDGENNMEKDSPKETTGDNVSPETYMSYMGAFRLLYPTGLVDNGKVLQQLAQEVLQEKEMSKFPMIIVLEDANTDLGVCRQVESKWDEILERWQDFLRWAVEHDRENWQIAGVVDAEGALHSGIFECAPIRKEGSALESREGHHAN